MKNRSYNTYETDVNSDRFTKLSYWDNLPREQMLRMSNGIDLGFGHEVLDSLKPLDLNKLKVGDDVYFGNSKGVVVELFTSDEELDLGYQVLAGGLERVVGIGVKRYLNYLHPQDRVNPEDKGYDESGDGITMSYFFYQGLDIEKYKNGGGVTFLYPGSFYVVRKNGEGSYPSVYNSIQEYQDKFE